MPVAREASLNASRNRGTHTAAGSATVTSYVESCADTRYVYTYIVHVQPRLLRIFGVVYCNGVFAATGLVNRMHGTLLITSRSSLICARSATSRA